MMAPDEALARLIALAGPVDVETLPLIEAAGRWTAEPVTALRTQPARDLSAMDGYAIRYADVPGPWQVLGESAAGSPYSDTVGAHEATRIFTGAALPRGTDSVVIQEDVTRDGDALTLGGDGPDSKGAHVRRAGSDFAAGQTLIEAGERLTPARIGLAAIGGHATLPVRRRVRVAIISTGDELVPPGTDAGLDRLPASNGIMLAAMLGALPVEIVDFGIIADDRAALSDVFTKARDCDIIVTSGGASVGDHDLVGKVAEQMGLERAFYKIAMRPGKPLMAGRLHGVPMLGLPGNPVSAIVCGHLFLLPMLRAMLGMGAHPPQTQTARLAIDLPANGLRSHYMRARLAAGLITPFDRQDSALLTILTEANALLVRPIGDGPRQAGEDVPYLPI